MSVRSYEQVDSPTKVRSLDAKSISLIGKVFMGLIALCVVAVVLSGVGIFNTKVLKIGTGADGAPGVSVTAFSLQDLAQLLIARNFTLIPGPTGANSTVPGPTGIVNLTNPHLAGGGSWTGNPTIDTLYIANDLNVAHNVQVLGAVSSQGLFAGNGTISTTADIYGGTLALHSQSVVSLDAQGGIRAVKDIQTTTGDVKTLLASMNAAGVVSGTQLTTGTTGATMDSAGVISGTRVTTGGASMNAAGVVNGAQVTAGGAVTLDSTGVTATVVKVSGSTITNSLIADSATIKHADFTDYLRASHIHSLTGTLNIGDSANTSVMNIGTGPDINAIYYGTGIGQTNHYLGGQLDNIYIAGNLVATASTYVTQTNLAVADSTIILNNGGLSGSSGLAGVCIADGGVNNTICARQSFARNSWQFQSALGPLVVLNQDLQTTAAVTFQSVTLGGGSLQTTTATMLIASTSAPTRVDIATGSAVAAVNIGTNSASSKSIAIGNATDSTTIAGTLTVNRPMYVNGGIFMKPLIGPQTTFNYYEEVSPTVLSLTFTGGGLTFVVPFSLVRIGKVVTMTQTTNVAAQTMAPGTSAFLFSPANHPVYTTRFWPVLDVYGMFNSLSNGVNGIGTMQVASTGAIYLFSGAYPTTFTGATGFGGLSISWALP
jgi:hypothetical protein